MHPFLLLCDCSGLQTAASIVTWLKRRAGPSADLITDLSQSDRLTDLEGLVVLGLFKVIGRLILTVFQVTSEGCVMELLCVVCMVW